MDFSKRLTTLRQQKGLTQEQLAPLVKMSRSALSLYELGKREPDFGALCSFADFFGTSTDYLLCRVDALELYLQPRPEEDDQFLSRVANMEGPYGEPLSQELRDIIREVVREEIARQKP